MTFFTVLATIGIYVYSSKKMYKYWAISTLLFTFAWVPTNIFYTNIYYLGTLGEISIRISAVFLLLRGFRFQPIETLEKRKVRIIILAIILVTYVPLVLFSLPPILSSLVVLPLMALALYNAGKSILKEMNHTKIQTFTGISFFFWSGSCILLMGYSFSSLFYPVSYFQSTGLSMTNMMLFLMYIEDTRHEVEEHLSMSQVMSSLITHDLRNYINIAFTALDLMEIEDDDNEHYWTIAEESLTSALAFMSNTRDTIRSLVSGNSEKKEIELVKMLLEVRKQVIIEHELDENSLIIDNEEEYIILESPLLKQIIWNIIDNAVTHTDLKSNIRISVVKHEGVSLLIQDNAGGMDDEIKTCINKLSVDSERLGIGLNIVIRLARLLMIDISVRDVIEKEEVTGSVIEIKLNAV